MTQRNTGAIKRLEFDFSPENVSLVKSLIAQGLSYKQVARKLNKDYCTKVKHKNLSNRTIANLLQTDVSETRSKATEHYSDSDLVHNKSEANNKAIEKKTNLEPIKCNEDILEIMSSNLSETMKIRCCKMILGT